MKIKAITGFKDILPEETPLWRRIENEARHTFHSFGFREIRLPILEKTELFARSIGEATDIVEKEMYTFTDKGQTLRPEATASLLRAFIEHGMHVQRPVHKLYTIGPMFRHERPQKGRLRQFHQMDVEIVGANEPQVDAELMAMGRMLLDRLGITATLEINSLGCPACRPAYKEQLVAFLQQKSDHLCADCRRRTKTNPLRVLDCKQKQCREELAQAPSILDCLCNECQKHFEVVRHYLDLLGVEYTLNSFMVRGLDYYTRTTFEFIAENLGAQSAVGAGGRYDGLIEQLGGPQLPGIGFALGMERLVLLMDKEQPSAADEEMDLYVAALGEQAFEPATRLVQAVRQNGLAAAMDYSNRSLKAQMKLAGKLKARFTLIIGENELQENQAILRDMTTRQQSKVALDKDPQSLASRLAEAMAT